LKKTEFIKTPFSVSFCCRLYNGFSLCVFNVSNTVILQGGPKSSLSHHQIIKKIVLKHASDVEFLCQIKVLIRHYKSADIEYAVTYFVTSLTMSGPRRSDMRK